MPDETKPSSAGATPAQGDTAAASGTAAPGAAQGAKPGDAAPKPPAPPPADKPKTVKLQIDGMDVEVAAGTNLIEAAKLVGVDIPYYCYHPRLTIAANCRMCLVATSASPKLVPGCQTPAAEGMKVDTKSPRVKDEQRAIMEFLLLNHPVDCAICDQAGECKLQDYYMQYDFKPSRLTGKKVLKNKRKVLGPLVVLDQERCIICTRCVRFMAEVAKEPQLGVFGRGSHEVIDTFPGKPLDSNYSGNTIDLCPVGALLSRDFRFKARAFFLSATPSVCTGCSRGCSTFVDTYRGQTYRYRPRENPQVNDMWMCDQGRLSYKYLNDERVLEVRVGRGNEGRTAPRQEASRLAAEKLKPFAGTDKLAFVVSPVASVEDMLAGFKLAKDGLKLDRVYVSGRAAGEGDHFLMREDKNPNRKGLEWIAAAFGMRVEPFEALTKGCDDGRIKAVYAVGGEMPTDDALVAALFNDLELVVMQAFNQNAVTNEAHLLLPASPHSEDHGTFVNFEGFTQRFVGAYSPSGESLPHWNWAAQILRELEQPVAWSSSRDVFRELAPSVPELASFNWDSAPRYIKGNRGIYGMPAAADSRPPAERERSLL